MAQVRIASALLGLITAGVLVACSGVSGTPTAATSAPPTVSVTPEPATVTVTASSRSNPAKVFDRERLQQGVSSVLTSQPPSGYGITGITDLSCPEQQPVKADTSFRCSLTIDGRATTVTIVVKNDGGLYEVNPPN